jgi:hypothetical protein
MGVACVCRSSLCVGILREKFVIMKVKLLARV